MIPPLKIRCSSLGRLMGGFNMPRPGLSEEAKSLIREIAVKNKYGREMIVGSKEIIKGNAVENESIELFSEVTGLRYEKSRKYYENDYLTGHIDIRSADTVIDIKSPFNLWTFLKADLSSDYAWQLMGYMILLDFRKATLAYCLVNAPEHLIFDEIKRACYMMNVFKEQEHEYGELETKVRQNMTFDDIPKERRVKLFYVPHDVEKVEMIGAKMKFAVDYYYFIYNQI